MTWDGFSVSDNAAAGMQGAGLPPLSKAQHKRQTPVSVVMCYYLGKGNAIFKSII